MLHSGRNPLTRLFRLLCFVLILSLAFPLAVNAAPTRAVTVRFDILSVAQDESVTIRTRDFPVNTQFTVLMGNATRKAIDGVESTTFNSGKGGVFEATFPIPEAVKGTHIIGIRIESADGYAGYNWFFNRTQTSLIRDPKAPPSLSFSQVQQNESVTVEARNLPPLTTFRVRIGPHYTFYQDYISAADVVTNQNGTARFTLDLGENVEDAAFIGVRMDGGGTYVYAAFDNVDGGALVPPADLVRIILCTLLDIYPIPAQDPRGDFDAIWTVQNTGLEDWSTQHYLFKYLGGTAMHKREDVLYLPYTVKRGWTIEFAVDMAAPETPGWHSTTWGLVNNKNEIICKLSVSVFVQEPQ